ncbi:MAG TPA: DinB family protein [Terracidiphilus sp.]|nr:DinB family protein [Terracidiphilus sp.]
MPIANCFLAEFEMQAPITRKYLERVPADKLTWKPHHKSLTAGQLALHIASGPSGILHLVMSNPQTTEGQFLFPDPADHAFILHTFDNSVAFVKEHLPQFSDAEMNESWRLMLGDRVVVEMPRADFLRNIMFSHLYQHRGQLSVYLRILDVPVPASWGPSADEMPSFAPPETVTA